MKLVRMDSQKIPILLQNDYIETQVAKTGSPRQIEWQNNPKKFATIKSSSNREISKVLGLLVFE